MSRLVYVCDEAARCAMGIIKGGDGSFWFFRNIKQHHEHPRRTSVGLALALVCSVYFPDVTCQRQILQFCMIVYLPVRA
jgi:hypothetical protein